MNNNQNAVHNQEMPVPKNTDMNDCDYLTDALTTEKNMGSNYETAMSEASNDSLYDEIKTIANETKAMARNIFNLQFKKGWYKLEKAENTKIDTVSQEYEKKLNELN